MMLFQGDMSRRLTVHTISKDFEHLAWNCRRSKNDICGYKNTQMNSTTVHKVKHNNTGKVCAGNIQQKAKLRMQRDFGEVKKLLRLGKEITLTCQTFRNSLPRCNSFPSCPTQRHHLQHHLARQLDQHSQNSHPPKGAPCDSKKEPQFRKNSDPSDHFLSTPTMSSSVPVNTDPNSTSMQST